jgi:hypothetical protein
MTRALLINPPLSRFSARGGVVNRGQAQNGKDPHLQRVVELEYAAVPLLHGLLQVSNFQVPQPGEFSAQGDIGAILVEDVVLHVPPEVEHHLVI